MAKKKQNNEETLMVVDQSEAIEAKQSELDLVIKELEAVKREIEEKKTEMQRVGRVLDEDEKRIVEKQKESIAIRSDRNAIIEQQKKRDNEKITGKFINRRAPGQAVKLTYMKYADDPVKWYPFEDGKVYTIPRGFVDQINEYYHTPHFTQKEGNMDPTKPSSVIHEVDTSNKKYAFVPINF